MRFDVPSGIGQIFWIASLKRGTATRKKTRNIFDRLRNGAVTGNAARIGESEPTLLADGVLEVDAARTEGKFKN